MLELAGLWAMRRLEAEGEDDPEQVRHCGAWLRACAGELLARSRELRLARLLQEQLDGRQVAHQIKVTREEIARLRSGRSSKEDRPESLEINP